MMLDFISWLGFIVSVGGAMAAFCVVLEIVGFFDFLEAAHRERHWPAPTEAETEPKIETQQHFPSSSICESISEKRSARAIRIEKRIQRRLEKRRNRLAAV